MTHPIPPGTRDVLPAEMRELREIERAVQSSFDAAGYGEVLTPTMEYEDVLRRGDDRAAGAGYRLFDEQGHVLALRSDMTIPLARVAATRLAEVEPPLRLRYLAPAYRAVMRGTGEPREFLQAGVELMGVESPAGDSEVLRCALDALDAAGLRRHRLGLGDAGIATALLDETGAEPAARAAIVDALRRRDLPALEVRLDRAGIASPAREVLARLPLLRGGPEILDRADGPSPEALERLRGLYEMLHEAGAGERVLLDLGIVHELGYYTGPVFEVYDPAVGFPLGGGGRYDGLLGRFGRPLPACGIALDVHRLHLARAAEEKLR